MLALVGQVGEECKDENQRRKNADGAATTLNGNAEENVDGDEIAAVVVGSAKISNGINASEVGLEGPDTLFD